MSNTPNTASEIVSSAVDSIQNQWINLLLSAPPMNASISGWKVTVESDPFEKALARAVREVLES